MITFYFTLGLMGVLMLGMGVGVIFAGKELKGSCGGTGQNCACDEQGIPRQCEVGDTEETASTS